MPSAWLSCCRCRRRTASLRHDPISGLALLGFATFIPFAFLLTGIDILIVSLALGATHICFAFFLPPVHVAPSVMAIVLGGSVAAGSVAAMMFTISKAGMNATARWWQESCERERLACARERRLREFTELAAARQRMDEFLQPFAERMADALVKGRCAVFTSDRRNNYRIAVTAGVAEQEGAVDREGAERTARVLLPKRSNRTRWSART
jgi:hypothetical protein